MRPLRFTRDGGIETANQGNRRFTIRLMPDGLFLAKVVDREGKRQDFVGSNVCATRGDAAKWLSGRRLQQVERKAS